jgi:hypothetical protein
VQEANQISDEGAMTIAAALKHNCSLQLLSLVRLSLVRSTYLFAEPCTLNFIFLLSLVRSTLSFC